MKGKIVMSGGFVYNNIYLRIDLIENAIRYLAPDGKEMIATSPIRSVILSDSVTGKEFKFVNSRFMLITGKIENGWYQMLDTGYATLYKHFTKVISENKPYGASTTEQKINAYGSYFVMVKSVLNPIKKIKELPDLLNDKKEELKAYLSTKNLSGRSDADYIALITYYNSLFLK